MRDLVPELVNGIEGLIVLAQVLASMRHLREERSIEALLKWSIQQDSRIDMLEKALLECRDR